jgi:hypothetical protein
MRSEVKPPRVNVCCWCGVPFERAKLGGPHKFCSAPCRRRSPNNQAQVKRDREKAMKKYREDPAYKARVLERVRREAKERRRDPIGGELMRRRERERRERDREGRRKYQREWQRSHPKDSIAREKVRKKRRCKDREETLARQAERMIQIATGRYSAVVVTCPCGASFDRRRRGHRYCSVRCVKRFWKMNHREHKGNHERPDQSAQP